MRSIVTQTPRLGRQRREDPGCWGSQCGVIGVVQANERPYLEKTMDDTRRPTVEVISYLHLHAHTHAHTHMHTGSHTQAGTHEHTHIPTQQNVQFQWSYHLNCIFTRGCSQCEFKDMSTGAVYYQWWHLFTLSL